MKHIREKIREALQHFSTGSFLAGVLFAVIAAGSLLVIWLYFPVSKNPSRPDSLSALKKISEAEDIIRRFYIEEVDESAQTDAMLRGLAEGLGDIYAEYYTKEEYDDLKNERAGLRKGIGVQIVQDEESGSLVVLYVMEDSPAERAGVQKNDRILSINGESTEFMTSSDAAALIKEAEGPVVLEVLRDKDTEPLRLEMEKTEILQVQAVYAGMLTDRTGYLRITTFNELTPDQFADEYAELRELGMNALIIDLRDNLGGLVSSCRDTLSQILPEGPIVYEKSRTGKERHKDSTGTTPIDIPLVLLVNGYTASASEIFAGAVRDYDLGILVGEQTYGKGVEQDTYHLSDGSALKFTTSVYYTPDHEDLNGVGLTPDEIVPLTEEDETDTQLERALEILLEETETAGDITDDQEQKQE